MAHIGSHSISLDNLSLTAPAAPAPTPSPTSPILLPPQSGDAPKAVAGQGASRHPLQRVMAELGTSPALLALPRELRDLITSELDTVDKLSVKSTCRQAYAEGQGTHFDITLSSASKLDQALAFFGQGKGKIDSLEIRARGMPNNFRRDIRMRAQQMAQTDVGALRPSLTNLVTLRLDQLRQLQGERFESLKRLDLVGCVFSDQGDDVAAQAVTILSSLRLEHIRLVNNDWLTPAHLDQLHQAGTCSFSLVGNRQLSEDDIAQFAGREGVLLDLDADAKELADRKLRTRTGEFDHMRNDPMQRLFVDAEVRGQANAMAPV